MRTKLTNRQISRLARLNELLPLLENGLRASAAEMKAALGSKAWTAYKAELEANALLALKGRQAVQLAKYKANLRRADTLVARMVKLPQVGPKAFKRYTLKLAAEHHYVVALEVVSDLVSTNTGAFRLFDRSITEETDSYPENIPRLIGSSSEYTIDDGYNSGASVLDIQVGAVRQALADLDTN